MLKELSTKDREIVRRIIKATNGKFFSVVFTKRTTGELRKMICRTGVGKFANGKGRKYDPADKDLMTVWDSQAWDPEKGDTGYRSINLRTVCEIRFRGMVHTFE